MSATPAAGTPFGRLHHGPQPLLLPNAWDAVSARIMQAAGASAIGTTSFGIAFAAGYSDGEQLPWPEALAVATACIDAVDIPVTVDVESGRGATPEAVARTVADVVAAGAAGINLEDTLPEGDGLVDVAAQCDRIAAARDAGGDALFINARCDAFFTAKAPPDPQGAALERAAAYVAAGADGIFVPGLLDLDALRAVVAAAAVPVNVMVGPGSPPVEALAEAGVRRLSQGAWGFAAAVGHLERLTRDYVEGAGYGREGDAPPGYQHLPALLRH